MDGEYEFNSRVIVFGLLFIGLMTAIFFPYQMLEEPKVVNVTPTPTPEVIVELIYITPTPDNGIYYAGEYLSGIRKLNRYFSWFRENATGYKDMSGHVKVYDYRMFKAVHVFDSSEGKYYEENANAGNKFLFIFVKIWLDDITDDDSRMWVPREEHFSVHYDGKSYSPIAWEKQYRIRELEETTNENNDYMIWYYGIFNTYSRDLKYAPTGGYYADPVYWLHAGESNAVDGYIVYEIPEDAKAEDIRVAANLYEFGDPIWILKL